jgi:hypothetical protein
MVGIASDASGAGSALTLGIAMNTRSSSNQICSTGGEFT